MRYFRSTRVVIGDTIRRAAVAVKAGRVVEILDHDAVPEGADLVDAGQLVLAPALVDTHVHINEPGRTEWEGFETATRAAIAGGIGTLIDMPLNSVPPTTTQHGFERKAEAAQGKLHCNVGFAGGLLPTNLADLRDLRKMGVFAFKSFLCESGVEEFPHVNEDVLRRAMPVLAELDVPLLVHAEAPGPLLQATERLSAAASRDVRKYSSWLDARPHEAEDEAISTLVELSRETGARTHVVHLSSQHALSIVSLAKNEGVRFSAETCPHYLHWAAENVPDEATQFKCAPPIREEQNRQALWRAVRNGVIETIVSDHSPCTPELKKLGNGVGDFMQAWGGIASLGLGLSIAWTHASNTNVPLERVLQWFTRAPADLVRLDQKGSIAVGADADLLLFDPDAQWEVTVDDVQFRHKTSPYLGSRLKGRVVATFLGGECAFDARGDVRQFSAKKLGRMLINTA